MRKGWQTTYLSRDHLLRRELPDLVARMDQLRFEVDLKIYGVDANSESGDGYSLAMELLEPLQIRCAELHEGSPGGSLNDPRHYDSGSVVTIDVMLSDNFEGGHMQTLEADGELHTHTFNRGDALIFPRQVDGADFTTTAAIGVRTLRPSRRRRRRHLPHAPTARPCSYKYHTVAEITGGKREVLVLEYWNGDEKPCDHRCTVARGDCTEFRR